MEPIIRGQKVTPLKKELTQMFRRNMTEEEKQFWYAVKGNRLGGFHFRRQQVICGFIADFYCHAARLVVEVDGSIHQQRVQEDKERDTIFQDLELTVERVKNEEINKDLPGVLNRIHHLCLERRRTLDNKSNQVVLIKDKDHYHANHGQR